MPMKFRELAKMLKANGWEIVRVTGSHYRFEHPTKGAITVPFHGNNVELKPGTLKSIIKQARLK